MIYDNVYEYIIGAIHRYGYTEEDVSFCQIERFGKDSYHTFQFSFDIIKENCKDLFWYDINQVLDNSFKIVFKDESWLFYLTNRGFSHKRKLDLSKLDILCVEDDMFIDLEDLPEEKRDDELSRLI